MRMLRGSSPESEGLNGCVTGKKSVSILSHLRRISKSRERSVGRRRFAADVRPNRPLIDPLAATVVRGHSHPPPLENV